MLAFNFFFSIWVSGNQEQLDTTCTNRAKAKADLESAIAIQKTKRDGIVGKYLQLVEKFNKKAHQEGLLPDEAIEVIQCSCLFMLLGMG